MQDNRKEQVFKQAVNVLPRRLQQAALALPPTVWMQCEEVRLRTGQAMMYSIRGREAVVPEAFVSAEDLQEVLSRATRYSVHSFEDNIRQGFVTIEGGHRLGLCGTAILRGDAIGGLRELSSINLRIAGQQFGAADTLMTQIYEENHVHSTLIVSPPAWGKTTLLRDCIRQLSEKGIRVGVADERFEIAGSYDGQPCFALGPTTDVLSGAPKAQAVLQLVKTMSPKVLVMDEITAPEDVQALSYAMHCGVAVIATAHALDFADFRQRPVYQPLLQSNVFSFAAEIRIQQEKREYHVVAVEGVLS